MRKKQVVVIGSSEEESFREESRRIGRFIAENDMVLITGGRGGIMESVSRGAYENGGTVIGILPGESLEEANPYCTAVVPTGIGFARNSVNILSGDVIIAIGGKSGTMSELAYAWMYRKPVICCTFARGWSSQFPEVRVDNRAGSKIYIAETVDMVREFLKELA